MERKRSRHRRLVDLVDRNSGERADREAGLCARLVRWKRSIVAVVHHPEIKNMSRGRPKKCRAVLRVRPIGGIGAADECEVASLPKVPEDVAGTLSVFVINLEDPVLVSQGDQQVTVARVEQRVRMRPIGERERMAIDIQMIERVLNPNRIEICIQVHDRISKHRGDAG